MRRPARIIGVIEAEQTEEDGISERNDRIVAVSTKCRTDGHLKSLKDLDPAKLEEIEQFFVSHNRVCGKRFKLLDVGGQKRAKRSPVTRCLPTQANPRTNAEQRGRRGPKADTRVHSVFGYRLKPRDSISFVNRN